MGEKSKFVFRTLINRTAKEAFDWHLRPQIIQRCLPPSGDVVFLSSEKNLFTLKMKVYPFIWRKITLQYQANLSRGEYTISQVKGPFSYFEYKIKVVPQSAHTCEIVDLFDIQTKLPSVAELWMKRILKQCTSHFVNYKHQLLHHDLELLSKYSSKTPKKILVSGSHGFIGKILCNFLEFAGHKVWHLTRYRDPNDPCQIQWNPEEGTANLNELEGFDAVFHLAGENIGEGLWTKKKKKLLLESRHKGTQNLVKLLSRLQKPPKTFVCASAIGIYGNRGSEVLKEESEVGRKEFVSEVCQYWERAARELQDTKARVVFSRFGMVLSGHSGALKRILLPFKLCIAGKIGDGMQYISWISIDDVIGSLYHILMTPSLSGPVNCVAPFPVTNGVFSKKLAKRLKRWQGPPVPAFFIHLLLGQKGDELLLSSTRAEPTRLIETGYHFQYPVIMKAFEHVI